MGDWVEFSNIIEIHINRKFLERPDMVLSRIGFGWAMMLSLRKLWPNLDRSTASKWMWEYLDLADISFGDPGYDWTPRAAKGLARQYVGEYGESP